MTVAPHSSGLYVSVAYRWRRLSGNGWRCSATCSAPLCAVAGPERPSTTFGAAWPIWVERSPWSQFALGAGGRGRWATPAGPKRTQLGSGTLGDFFGFVHGSLIPYLKCLKSRPGATARQKVISEIMSGVERVRIDTERNFLDVLDKVDEISRANVDSTHIFTLS